MVPSGSGDISLPSSTSCLVSACVQVWCKTSFHGQLFRTLLQIHHLNYSEGANEIVSEGVYSHPHEIWDLACSPFDARLFSTVYRSGETPFFVSCQVVLLQGITYKTPTRNAVELTACFWILNTNVEKYVICAGMPGLLLFE